MNPIIICIHEGYVSGTCYGVTTTMLTSIVSRNIRNLWLYYWRLWHPNFGNNWTRIQNWEDRSLHFWAWQCQCVQYKHEKHAVRISFTLLHYAWHLVSQLDKAYFCYIELLFVWISTPQTPFHPSTIFVCWLYVIPEGHLEPQSWDVCPAWSSLCSSHTFV